MGTHRSNARQRVSSHCRTAARMPACVAYHLDASCAVGLPGPRRVPDPAHRFPLAPPAITLVLVKPACGFQPCMASRHPARHMAHVPATTPAEQTQRLHRCVRYGNAQQVYGACFGLPGQSGSAVIDLADNRIVGVLSGYFVAENWTSIWVPITAQHFAALERWRWRPGMGVSAIPPAFPSPPPPPPFNVSRHLCECQRSPWMWVLSYRIRCSPFGQLLAELHAEAERVQYRCASREGLWPCPEQFAVLPPARNTCTAHRRRQQPVRQRTAAAHGPWQRRTRPRGGVPHGRHHDRL